MKDSELKNALPIVTVRKTPNSFVSGICCLTDSPVPKQANLVRSEKYDVMLAAVSPDTSI